MGEPAPFDTLERYLDDPAAGAGVHPSAGRIRGDGGEPVVTDLDGVPAGVAADGDAVWVTVRES